VLPEVQEKFAKAYKAAGGDCDYRLFENSVHEWVAEPGPQTDKAVEVAKEFIARQLKLDGSIFLTPVPAWCGALSCVRTSGASKDETGHAASLPRRWRSEIKLGQACKAGRNASR
jgi:hypothetical protein